MKKILVSCFWFFALILRSQTINLVPNAGFEKIIGQPEKWFFTGKDFDLVFEEWKSPTAASPDVYSDKIPIPVFWREKGFFGLSPYEGKSMVGLTLFGCNLGKLHCREYISAPLLEPLVIGQQYNLSIWVAPMEEGVKIDGLQVAFDREVAQTIDDRLLDLKPLYDLPISNKNSWQKLELNFYAETEAQYLTIGNFRNDEHTKTIRGEKTDKEPFAYYYIDEVSLKKIPPILTRKEIERYDSIELANTSIEINNIYFDFDETKLLPGSYQELNKLLLFLTEHPKIKINIIGHTDHIGSAAYNRNLSYQRAKAVADFLIRHYIIFDRMKVKGQGYDQPIASNLDEAGRQKNRRVVFEIIKP
jgi:outer membrane protein OmpA-like peptidoglycan-associated protein